MALYSLTLSLVLSVQTFRLETEDAHLLPTADAATYRPYISINGLSPGTNLFMKTRQVTSTLQISSLMHVKF